MRSIRGCVSSMKGCPGLRFVCKALTPLCQHPLLVASPGRGSGRKGHGRRGHGLALASWAPGAPHPSSCQFGGPARSLRRSCTISHVPVACLCKRVEFWGPSRSLPSVRMNIQQSQAQEKAQRESACRRLPWTPRCWGHICRLLTPRSREVGPRHATQATRAKQCE